MATRHAPTRQAITLKGSTIIVTDFFKFAVNTFVYSKDTANTKADNVSSESCISEESTLQMTSIW